MFDVNYAMNLVTRFPKFEIGLTLRLTILRWTNHEKEGYKL